MTEKEYENGIKEYEKKYKEKMYSEEVKELHKKYIRPLLEKASFLYLSENEKAEWSGSFFQGEKILSRIGMREKGIYKEEEKIYLTKDIIAKTIK